MATEERAVAEERGGAVGRDTREGAREESRGD